MAAMTRPEVSSLLGEGFAVAVAVAVFTRPTYWKGQSTLFSLLGIVGFVCVTMLFPR